MTSREWQDMSSDAFTGLMRLPYVMWHEKAGFFLGRLACCLWGSAMVDQIMGVLDKWLPLE